MCARIAEASMLPTLIVLYGLAVVVFRATRSPPHIVEYREGEILE